jgi:uncharacterized protein with HEPN domain
MKDDSIYLEHIENSLNRIISYTSGISREAFLENAQLQDACIRHIEIMGEATKRISSILRLGLHTPFSGVNYHRCVIYLKV